MMKKVWKHRQTEAQKQITRNKRVEGDHKGAEKVIYRKKVVCRPDSQFCRMYGGCRRCIYRYSGDARLLD